MYLWWSLYTLYLLTYQVRVTIGDSGLCCFVVLWHLFMLINSLVCWLLNVESVSYRIGLWWLIVYYNHWSGILTLILYPYEKSSAMERSQNDLTANFLLDVLLDRHLSPWCSSWPLSFTLMFFLDCCLSPWCSSWPQFFSLMFLTAFSLMFLLTAVFLLDVPLDHYLSPWCSSWF